jgi:hypothetical protein
MRQNKYVFYFIFKIYIIIRVLIEKKLGGGMYGSALDRGCSKQIKENIRIKKYIFLTELKK